MRARRPKPTVAPSTLPTTSPGADPETVVDTIRADWRYIVDDAEAHRQPCLPARRRQAGAATLGLRFRRSPRRTRRGRGRCSIDLKRGRDGLAAATLVGGVPAYWRTLERDSKPAREWADVYRAFDVLSPWAVGRFGDAQRRRAVHRRRRRARPRRNPAARPALLARRVPGLLVAQPDDQPRQGRIGAVEPDRPPVRPLHVAPGQRPDRRRVPTCCTWPCSTKPTRGPRSFRSRPASNVCPKGRGWSISGMTAAPCRRTGICASRGGQRATFMRESRRPERLEEWFGREPS